MHKHILHYISVILLSSPAFSQPTKNVIFDSTTHLKFLPDITVVGRGSRTDIQQMPEIVGTSIYAGKKSSLIVLENVKGNVVNNTMRQVMAKVPGIHVWESDGSGIQIGIAARGLSPNRSWEFNVRQNGYDIAADPYGYPEAYYNPQLQAVQRIEVVRGHGALQYGPQFGGLVNYILRNGSEISTPIQFETQQTVGSNGLINSYNAIGGKRKKLHYYSFFDHRNGEGYRQNSRYYSNAAFGTVTWTPFKKWSLTAELMRSNIRSQQPGGITDAELNGDIRISQRARNWMDITWTTAAIIGNYTIDERTIFNVKLFGIMGDRSSVGYFPAGGIIVTDSTNKSTGTNNPRNLNTDKYRNLGMEARFLTNYQMLRTKSVFSAGFRLYKGSTHRIAAEGKGSTGFDYNMSISDGLWTRDLDFGSYNGAVFAENMFRIGDKLTIIPGVRYEWISGSASGRIGSNGNTPVRLQEQTRKRSFLMAGIGAEYHLTLGTELYANISQAYRPVQFADLTAPPTSDVIDQNLKDATGFNADLGYRGKLADYLFFDLSFYLLQYNDRIGTLVQQRNDGSFYNFRTNVGNSRSKGMESMVEFDPSQIWFEGKGFELRTFVSYAFHDARYGEFTIITRNSSNVLVEKNLRDKKVENAPEHILRAGLTGGYRKLSVTGQISHVSSAFSDANNTILPTDNAQNGIIPSYTVIDLTGTYKINATFNLKAGVNNLMNAKYFTRRSSGYPGPGALPSDGRTYWLSVAVRI